MKENKLIANNKGIELKGDSVFLKKCLKYLIDIAMQDKILKAWLIWYVTPDEWKPTSHKL